MELLEDNEPNKATPPQESEKAAEKALKNNDNDGRILKQIAAFKAAFEAGEISKRISPQKQARHIKGSKQFEEYVANLKAANSDNLPAYLREDLKIADLENLIVNRLKGNITLNADGSFTEFVTCDEIIGYYYKPTTKEYIPTHRVMVKYSLGGRNIHIIPVKERGNFIYE